MYEKIERVTGVPHLYRRKYRCLNGELTTRYYGIFSDKKKGVRRTFALGINLPFAKEKLKIYEGKDVMEEDFDNHRVRGLTLSDAVERFLQVKASKKTIDKDRISCKRLKAFFSPDCLFESIVTSNIEAYKQKRLGEITRYGTPTKRGTIDRELSCLVSIYTLAQRDRIIDRVPYIELFRENNERNRTATQDEFDTLLQNSPTHLTEILMCLWDTGMRKGEVLELTWDRVDLKNDLIRLGVENTKEKKAKYIPLSPRLKELLNRIRKRDKEGTVIRMTDHVFLFRGKPIKRFDRAYGTACDKSGITGLWIHDLRATFATRKIAEGQDRDWVKMITGHKTDHVFSRYNRPSMDDLRKVVAKDG